ncbi:MAG: hypothetical protein EU536_02605 [Promethearchaeota archaeon]|nr:MAG: hypothetical protein EU536_02605 [Candidatus Lokiarchaeota archaeon]
MIFLNLNYFNTIQGPQIFHWAPEGADENLVQSVANLLNISELIKQKFFLYEGADFKTVSQYIEIPSEWARGKKEMLLLSVILPPGVSLENKAPVKLLLEKVEAEINNIENGFMAFYEYDYSKMEDYEDEIEDLATEVRSIIDKYGQEASLAVKEAKKISMEQIKEIYQQRKTLGIYVIDEDVLDYLYESEQDKTPFVRFADFVESGISVFTSEECINESALDDSLRQIIKDVVGNRITEQSDIDKLKEGVDPRRLPSDAKLSLIVLIKYLREINPDYDLTIVSPNQRFLRFIQDYYPDLRSLPPSSYLLEIINNLENGESREYFETLRKKLMNFELQKAMKAEGEGASSEHLSWLIEKAIGVASQPLMPVPSIEEKREAGLDQTELELINKFIAGEPIIETDYAKIEEYEEFLNGVKEAQFALVQIQEEIAKDELRSAQTKIFATIKKLKDSFLLASSTIEEKLKRNQIQILLTNFIANFEFLAALSHLNLRQLDQSIERFSLSSVFSAVAEQKNKVLISNYLKSITCLFNDAYKDAIHNFAITAALGQKYNYPGYQIMCQGGKAISELLSGESAIAKMSMDAAALLIPENENDALFMFHEFGDIFYMMGKPEVAIHLYNEALELAIFANDRGAVNEIYDKLERSFYAVGAYNTPLSAELHNLINRAHTLKDAETIENYNIAIAKLGDINKLLFFETFPYITDEWVSGEYIPKELLEPFDLLHVVVTTKFRKRGGRRKINYTDLYCYNKKLGGVIVRLPEELDLKLKDIPIIYQIALNTKNAQFKIIDTTKEEKQNFYARAVIQVKSKMNINFKRIFPDIFGKYFES